MDESEVLDLEKGYDETGVVGNLCLVVVDGIAIPDHDFSVSPFWAQIHGLSVGKMNRANTESIGLAMTIGVVDSFLVMVAEVIRHEVDEPDPNTLHLSSPKPLYFVTEPTDSPPSHTSQPAVDHHNPNLPALIEEINPNGSPTRNSSLPTLEPPSSITSGLSPTEITHSNSSSLDKSLATVFHERAIKRKSTEDSIDSNRSKLLHLCAPPNLSSHTQKPKQSSTRKSVRRKDSSISAKKNFGETQDLFAFESSLCDVPVQQAITSLEIDLPLVPRLGRTLTTQALGDLVHKNRPSIVFLMETKNNKVFLETIRHKLGFNFATYFEPVGLSGGLALWWKPEVDIDIETSSKNIVHTIISNKFNSFVCAASFIYGYPNREGRDQVWEDLMGIGRTEILPWLCIGDFNEILSSEYKMGGNSPYPARFTSFHGMLSVCGLVDLGF
ncbi:hypothetical protein RHSIM_Rhsim03G0108700 [Rhododendron simsii]|uniref:Endonuclease/exonuclease/phosphatase domain-containing protein n=1 Tax=Rhododendron simsii TaxID=118357 RepID=A0A834LT76_RHOSS|nr:hypothetical protein RHSIM_Rhsim03G0108700 [Rhododendron simsii]